MIAYLDVVTVQASALSNERTVLTLLQSRLVASVQLIAALGGGWDGAVDSSKPEIVDVNTGPRLADHP